MFTSLLLLTTTFSLVFAKTGYQRVHGLQLSDITLSTVSANIRLQNHINSITINVENATLPIDHWNTSFGTYNNRFAVLDKFYKPGKPIFVFDSGEQDAFAEPNFDRTTNAYEFPTESFEVQLLKDSDALGIFWEHRYYGRSLPEHDDGFKNPEKYFRYLTAEQALADVPFFAWNFSLPARPNVDLTPTSTPWVFFGGSYPGMRAAWLRQEFPETIFAAWASSAPVQAAVDMPFYWDSVWDGLNAYGFGNCTKDIQAVVRYVDEQLGHLDPNVSIALKKEFYGEKGTEVPHSTFVDILTHVLDDWQSLGARGGDGKLGSFCDHLSFDPTTNKTSDAQGWAATKGPMFSIQRWASSPMFKKILKEETKDTCVDKTTNPGSDDLTVSAEKPCVDTPAPRTTETLSWTWQYCTEFGYFQTSNVGPKQLISKYIDVAHHQDICHRSLQGQVPDLPAVEATNKRFGGWNINPPRTFWGGGRYDPWRSLSPLSDLPNSPHLQLSLSDHISVPSCEASSASVTPSRLFRRAGASYGILSEGVHCGDMTTESLGVFEPLLKQWLSCFKVGVAKRPDISKMGNRAKAS
jgi:hypothetical protein